VIELKIPPPVKPIAADVDEVHILGHDLRQFMPTVFCPSGRKLLGNLADRGFVAVSLGVSGAWDNKKRKE
jgi:hypothetical protein